MKIQLVTPYRVSHLQRYGVTGRGNVTSVYPPLDVDADRVDGELLVSARGCHRIHSTLVTGLCERHVFWTRHSTFE